MDTLLTVLLVVVTAVFGFVVLSYLALVAVGAGEAARSRRAERAERRTWEPVPADLSLLASFAGPPFDVGRDRVVSDARRGRHDGRPFLTFRLAFTDDHDGEPVRHEYSVIALDLGRDAPSLTVVPLERPAPHLESDEPVVEIDHPGITAYFRVHSDSPAFARAFVAPEMIGTPMLGWRTAGSTLLGIRASTWSPLQVRNCLGLMSGVLGRVPPEAWDSPGS